MVGKRNGDDFIASYRSTSATLRCTLDPDRSPGEQDMTREKQMKCSHVNAGRSQTRAARKRAGGGMEEVRKRKSGTSK